MPSTEISHPDQIRGFHTADGRADSLPRVTVDGKFFRAGPRRFLVRGVTYGPFALDGPDPAFLSPGQTELDLRWIRELGANVLRVYHTPPRWFLDVAAEHQLRVLIDIPWSTHLCFLDSTAVSREALDNVARAVATAAAHPAVFAYSVANEIPPEVVRWNGTRRTAGFLEQLIDVGKAADPKALFTFTSFPSTEFLQPQNLDFDCYNVFLHERRAFESYLARLQMLADTRPLVLGETGIDSLREGEVRQAEILDWQIQTGFRQGLAGLVVFGFTDEWHRNGRPVEDWAFGLTRSDRQPKRAYWNVQSQFAAAPNFQRTQWPKVSVIVACYNGACTLNNCLESLSRLRYPDSEIILVDDGSTDGTAQIVTSFPNIVYLQQPHLGLSVARNTGIQAARGEILAFTDADCRADEDWLLFLVDDLLRGGYAAVGGHNLLPPDDSRIAAAVMASPGGPAHVMLTDREAEHIPGCNMAFHRWALEEIGGFDPVFHRAGDDVDVCWRLLANGQRIGFSPGGFVWHYRRSTIRGYLRQQAGYGEAEAQLARKHPRAFNTIGGGLWRGRIYSATQPNPSFRRPLIYHGPFATGPFQRVYESSPEWFGALLNSLEYHALVTLPLLFLAFAFPATLPLVVASLGASLAYCLVAAAQAPIPRAHRAFWSRPLVAGLFLVQPIVRGWARYRGRFTARSLRPTAFRRPTAARVRWRWQPDLALRYWSSGEITRVELLQRIFEQLDLEAWEWRRDTGWGEFDAEVYGQRWSRVRLVTVTEDLGAEGRNLGCRLQTHWSLAARWAAGALVAALLVVVAAYVPTHRWLLWSLLALPALGLLIERERRLVAQLLGALIEEVAGRLNLTRLPDP